MRHLLTAVPTALALAVSGLALTASPAAADYTTTVDGLSTETPGHVTGTVTSDAPLLKIAATTAGGTTMADHVVVDNPDGSVAFDLETWGLAEGRLRVATCDAAQSCTDAVSVDIIATDVVPAVTFPADTTIGQEDYVVTVDDPDGGGQLLLRNGLAPSRWAKLSRSGASDPVTLYDEGATTVEVLRCSARSAYLCTTTGLRKSLTVNRQITASTSSDWGLISTRLGQPYSTTVSIQDPETTGAVDLAWQVLQHDGGPVDGYAGTVSLVRDANDKVHPSIDLTGLPDGYYEMSWVPSTATEEFGTVTGTSAQRSRFTVDNSAPAVTRIGLPRNNVYPYRDGYRDVTTITVFPGYVDDGETVRVDLVRKADGRRVRTLVPATPYASPMAFRWNGRNGAGLPVTAGQYQVRVRAWDAAGNLTGKTMAREITVVRKKLSARSMARTVRAAGSMFDKQVGACSTLRRPSLRGWVGSVGLYSNTRCDRGFDPSSVASLHVTRLPHAAKYGYVRVSTYGGAATRVPGSLAYITYLNRRGNWVAHTRLWSRVANHAGARRLAAPYRQDGRWLVWSTYTAHGAAYDVKSFTVRMNYWVLVAD